MRTTECKFAPCVGKSAKAPCNSRCILEKSEELQQSQNANCFSLFSNHLPFNFICNQRQRNSQSLLCLSLKSAKSTTVVNFLVFQRQHLQKCNYAGNLFTLLFSTLAEHYFLGQNEKYEFLLFRQTAVFAKYHRRKLFGFSAQALSKRQLRRNHFTTIFLNLGSMRILSAM